MTCGPGRGPNLLGIRPAPKSLAAVLRNPEVDPWQSRAAPAMMGTMDSTLASPPVPLAQPGPRLHALWAMSVAALISGCPDNTFDPKDAGPTGPGSDLTDKDIGTPCYCELEQGHCKRNPTNSCPKSGMVCLIATPDPNHSNAGNALWEAPMFSVGRVTTDGGVVYEGECTIVTSIDYMPPCPLGTVAVSLSTGINVCKRSCESDQECERDNWVCDQPLLDQASLHTPPVVERGLALNLCRPACVADFPDCLRSTACLMDTDQGCFRSPGQASATHPNVGIYVGDRNGARTCASTGHCVPTTQRSATAVLGSQCHSAAECPVNYLCVSDQAYSNNPDGLGFCTWADCNPFPQQGQGYGCPQAVGQTCEVTFELPMCFSDCTGAGVCGMPGQMCLVADQAKIYNTTSTGQPIGWKGQHCLDCDLANMCP